MKEELLGCYENKSSKDNSKKSKKHFGFIYFFTAIVLMIFLLGFVGCDNKKSDGCKDCKFFFNQKILSCKEGLYRSCHPYKKAVIYYSIPEYNYNVVYNYDIDDVSLGTKIGQTFHGAYLDTNVPNYYSFEGLYSIDGEEYVGSDLIVKKDFLKGSSLYVKYKEKDVKVNFVFDTEQDGTFSNFEATCGIEYDFIGKCNPPDGEEFLGWFTKIKGNNVVVANKDGNFLEQYIVMHLFNYEVNDNEIVLYPLFRKIKHNVILAINDNVESFRVNEGTTLNDLLLEINLSYYYGGVQENIKWKNIQDEEINPFDEIINEDCYYLAEVINGNCI